MIGSMARRCVIFTEEENGDIKWSFPVSGTSGNLSFGSTKRENYMKGVGGGVRGEVSTYGTEGIQMVLTYTGGAIRLRESRRERLRGSKKTAWDQKSQDERNLLGLKVGRSTCSKVYQNKKQAWKNSFCGC